MSSISCVKVHIIMIFFCEELITMIRPNVTVKLVLLLLLKFLILIKVKFIQI